MARLMLFSVTLLLGAVATAAEPVEWSIDKTHSTIGFTVRHLTVAKVRGHFDDYEAKIWADPKTGKVSAVEAVADAASVNTRNEKRDAHLRSDDFFKAEAFPQLKLKTKNIKWRGKKFTADVELTIRDVTKTVKAKGEMLGARVVNFGDGDQLRAGYYGEAKIKRKDFGLRFDNKMNGAAIVGEEVTIVIDVEMSHKM